MMACCTDLTGQFLASVRRSAAADALDRAATHAIVVAAATAAWTAAAVAVSPTWPEARLPSQPADVNPGASAST